MPGCLRCSRRTAGVGQPWTLEPGSRAAGSLQHRCCLDVRTCVWCWWVAWLAASAATLRLDPDAKRLQQVNPDTFHRAKGLGSDADSNSKRLQQVNPATPINQRSATSLPLPSCPRRYKTRCCPCRNHSKTLGTTTAARTWGTTCCRINRLARVSTDAGDQSGNALPARMGECS